MNRRCFSRAKWVHVLFFCGVVSAWADGDGLWVFLRDKVDENGVAHAWDGMGQVHSRALQDIPVYSVYVERLRAAGFTVRTRSRWLNAVSVDAKPAQKALLQELEFVQSVKRVRSLLRPEPPPFLGPPVARLALQDTYGVAFEQLAQAGIIPLHQQGFTGRGVRIAVIDNGFHYINHRAFSQKLNIVAQRDFVNDDSVVTDEVEQPITGDETRSGQNIHGAQVLSIMAAYDPNRFIGVAPDAEYILAKTEDNGSELPIEEDRWIAGLEWADSLGADVVNSSLGYNIWDVGGSYEYADLDGRTALTSIAAAMAVKRGMVVVVAAGNEADVPWHYITAPGDAEGVITVGSVDVPVVSSRSPQIANTSSRGPTADGRIKPDIVAPGQGVIVADLRGGDYVRSSGTSFAAPLVSGICALLLQANPSWGPSEVLDRLRSTALDLGEAGPDTIYGWGQVDALAASDIKIAAPENAVALAPFPNPARDGSVYFPLLVNRREEIELSIFDAAGNLVFSRDWSMLAGDYTQAMSAPKWEMAANTANGLYFYRVHSASLDQSGTIAVVRR
jgi:serine protease AprX